MAYKPPYVHPYSPPQVVAQPVMVAYTPPPTGPLPICAACRQPCQGSHYKCINCTRYGRDYFLCGVCHSRLPKKSGGIFGLNGIINSVNKDLATIAHALDGERVHESFHEFQRIDPAVYLQPAQGMPAYSAVPPPQQGYPPQQGFPHPQQGFPPPHQGYAPQPGFPPPQQGFPPPQQGYMAPQQGYPAAGPPQGYPAAQPGYPPPQPVYQQGYPVSSPHGSPSAPPPQQWETNEPPPSYVPQAVQQPYSPGAYVPPAAQTVAQAAQPANRVQLSISCSKLPQAQFTGERPNPMVAVLLGSRELGRTEAQTWNTDPTFKNPVIFTKDEAAQGKLTFIVFDSGDKKLGIVKDVSFADIVSAGEWHSPLTDAKTGYRLPTGILNVRAM